ncbi:hypothetical protein, partial [Rhizobium acidisoli]|uniref:hypothetical protein n=1 Tax=Rhizobium acidisoli TaxID=1538158 RepID=UPI001AEBBAB5
GWSSPVARQAHNLKAAGSNPAPATKSSITQYPKTRLLAGFCVVGAGKTLFRAISSDDLIVAKWIIF